MKKYKGITLISLIITIIVILIIVGISISILFGENGILSKAIKAKDDTVSSQENENKIFSSYLDSIERFVIGTSRETPSSIITSVGIDLNQSLISDCSAYLKIVTNTSEETYIGYHVLFGTSQNNMKLIQVENKDIIKIISLNKSTKYYVKVIAYDRDNNFKASDIVEFTTKNITIPYEEYAVDYWTLTSTLDSSIPGRESFEPTSGTPSFDNAMYLDGLTTIETQSNYVLPQNYTIAIQFKNIQRYDTTRYAWFLGIGGFSVNPATINDFGFLYDSYYPYSIFCGTNGAYTYRSLNIAIDQTWHTMVGTYDGTKITYYYDGSIIGTGNISNAQTDLSSKMAISKDVTSCSRLKGYFKNLIVYNTALNSTQIMEMNFGE